MQIITRLVMAFANGLHAQRGSLFPWLSVFFGVGITLFFQLKFEPPVTALWASAALAAALITLANLSGGRAIGLILPAFAMIAAGFAVAGWRTHDVSAPVLGWRYYGPVEGRVIGIDRSASDAVRLTLDNVWMGRISQTRTPERVRISLHGKATDGSVPPPGARIMTTAHVSPPSGPVEPGGFDFQRHSWFLKLGGVGYTRVPVMLSQAPDPNHYDLIVFKIRMAVSNYVRDALPGNVGGFAAAVTSGDRSGMSQDTLEDLRASNLAHLLAISGLHMGLLTGFVFMVLRFSLALIPNAALLWPIKSIAAGGALIAGAIYLALSGGNVATERAFVMAAVALTAVMLGRRAISLRSVAIAALIVLFLRPEALLGPGFQMSFAATTALVGAYAGMRDMPWRAPKWAKPVTGVLVSSGIAGLATAPIAAAHFNAVAHYGLFANMLSVPVMGTLVVPAAVFAALLAPLGLDQLGLIPMGWGLWWILEVADYTANIPGARSYVPGPAAAVLPLLCGGAIFTVLWQGRVRWIGLAPMLCAFALWSQPTRPDLLISDTGSIVGIMTPDGRALSRERGSGFVANNWLENDGDKIEQADAHQRWTTRWQNPAKGQATAMLGDTPIYHLSGKRAAAAPPNCNTGILIANNELASKPDNCTIFDPERLRSTGSVAISYSDGQISIQSVRDHIGTRAWTRWPDDAQ